MRFSLLLAAFCGSATSVAAANVTVSTASALVDAINTNNGISGGGNVISMNAGTYTLSTSVHAGGDPNVGLDITQPVTLQPVSGASVTLSMSGLYIGIRLQASNSIVDGLTLSGAQFGIQVQNQNGAVNSGYVSNVIIRNLSVSTSGNGGQAISGAGLLDSIIEKCTVTSTYNTGISLAQGPTGNNSLFSLRNLIVNNTVVSSSNAHGYAITFGDYNIIAGNTVSNTSASGDGILVNGGQHNYIFRNTLTNQGNGIVLTKTLSPIVRQSNRNYVGNNSVRLNQSQGTDSLWFDYDSNYNMGFLNEGSFSGEGGMSLFNSIGNYVRGNNFHDNNFGGIIVQKDNGSGTTVPTHNSIQQNYLHDYPQNGALTITSDSQNDYGFNFMAGPAGTNTGNRAGIIALTSAGSTFYSNIMRDLVFGELFQTSSTGTLYLNRHLSAPNHFVDSSSTPQFDSGSSMLGGSYYKEFTSANGNPGTTPYVNGANGFDSMGGYWIDRYPYASESLGKNYAVSVRLPSGGAYIAAGTQRTIAWSSQGCTNVNLYLVNSSGSVIQTIATNSPDYGYYRWAVPSIATGSYAVRADCLNSSYATVGKSSTGGLFMLTTSDLVLLSPQANLISDYPGTTKISWYKSANVPSVDVYIRYSDVDSFVPLQFGVTADYLSIPTPQVTSNKISVALVSGSYGDSTDGWFTIRSSSTGALTAPSGSDNFYVGTPYLLEWVSPTNSDYVTIDLISGGVTKNIATQLADFGNYLMLVPDAPGSSAMIRITFYNSSGTVLQQLSGVGGSVLSSSSQPNTMSIVAGSGQSTLVSNMFPMQLQVQLINSTGSGIPGVAVMFAAPTSGASGNFSGSLSTTVLTNSSGIATTSVLTANGVAGTYGITAMADSLTATFTLTNTAGSPLTRIGAYANGYLSRDVNGDGRIAGDPYTFFVTPDPNDIAIYGDWNGDGKTKIGVYRDGFWVLDYNGNGMYDSADKFYAFGGKTSDGYIPVVGDWSGSGTTKVGFYKMGFWGLDYNGDGMFNAGDKYIGIGGNANEVPLVGDWNHDGRTKVGVFYPYNGYGLFVLDTAGNGFDANTSKIYPFLSYAAGDRPVVGDWTGNGLTKVGVFRNGFWVIDYNGDGVYTNDGTDRFYPFSSGNSSQVPIVGDWNGNGISKIGIYAAGLWLLDFNGNGSFDAADKMYNYSITSTDRPVIGRW